MSVLTGLNPSKKYVDAKMTANKELCVSTIGTDSVVEAVIAESGTTSTEIDFRGYKYLSFLMPAAWTEATLTLYGSATEGGTKVAIKNDINQSFPAMTVAVDTIYTIDVNALMIAPMPYLAFVASVAQDAERKIKVMLKG